MSKQTIFNPAEFAQPAGKEEAHAEDEGPQERGDLKAQRAYAITGDSARDSVRKLLFQLFEIDARSQQIEIARVSELVEALECEVSTQFPDSRQRQYRDRARLLQTKLQGARFTQTRQQLLSGKITAAEVCSEEYLSGQASNTQKPTNMGPRSGANGAAQQIPRPMNGGIKALPRGPPGQAVRPRGALPGQMMMRPPGFRPQPPRPTLNSSIPQIPLPQESMEPAILAEEMKKQQQQIEENDTPKQIQTSRTDELNSSETPTKMAPELPFQMETEKELKILSTPSFQVESENPARSSAELSPAFAELSPAEVAQQEEDKLDKRSRQTSDCLSASRTFEASLDTSSQLMISLNGLVDQTNGIQDQSQPHAVPKSSRGKKVKKKKKKIILDEDVFPLNSPAQDHPSNSHQDSVLNENQSVVRTTEEFKVESAEMSEPLPQSDQQAFLGQSQVHSGDQSEVHLLNNPLNELPDDEGDNNVSPTPQLPRFESINGEIFRGVQPTASLTELEPPQANMNLIEVAASGGACEVFPENQIQITVPNELPQEPESVAFEQTNPPQEQLQATQEALNSVAEESKDTGQGVVSPVHESIGFFPSDLAEQAQVELTANSQTGDARNTVTLERGVPGAIDERFELLMADNQRLRRQLRTASKLEGTLAETQDEIQSLRAKLRHRDEAIQNLRQELISSQVTHQKEQDCLRERIMTHREESKQFRDYLAASQVARQPSDQDRLISQLRAQISSLQQSRPQTQSYNSAIHQQQSLTQQSQRSAVQQQQNFDDAEDELEEASLAADRGSNYDLHHSGGSFQAQNAPAVARNEGGEPASSNYLNATHQQHMMNIESGEADEGGRLLHDDDGHFYRELTADEGTGGAGESFPQRVLLEHQHQASSGSGGQQIQSSGSVLGSQGGASRSTSIGGMFHHGLHQEQNERTVTDQIAEDDEDEDEPYEVPNSHQRHRQGALSAAETHMRASTQHQVAAAVSYGGLGAQMMNETSSFAQNYGHTVESDEDIAEEAEEFADEVNYEASNSKGNRQGSVGALQDESGSFERAAAASHQIGSGGGGGTQQHKQEPQPPMFIEQAPSNMMSLFGEEEPQQHVNYELDDEDRENEAQEETSAQQNAFSQRQLEDDGENASRGEEGPCLSQGGEEGAFTHGEEENASPPQFPQCETGSRRSNLAQYEEERELDLRQRSHGSSDLTSERRSQQQHFLNQQRQSALLGSGGMSDLEQEQKQQNPEEVKDESYPVQTHLLYSSQMLHMGSSSASGSQQLRAATFAADSVERPQPYHPRQRSPHTSAQIWHQQTNTGGGLNSGSNMLHSAPQPVIQNSQTQNSYIQGESTTASNRQQPPPQQNSGAVISKGALSNYNNNSASGGNSASLLQSGDRPGAGGGAGSHRRGHKQQLQQPNAPSATTILNSVSTAPQMSAPSSATSGPTTIAAGGSISNKEQRQGQGGGVVNTHPHQHLFTSNQTNSSQSKPRGQPQSQGPPRPSRGAQQRPYMQGNSYNYGQQMTQNSSPGGAGGGVATTGQDTNFGAPIDQHQAYSASRASFENLSQNHTQGEQPEPQTSAAILVDSQANSSLASGKNLPSTQGAQSLSSPTSGQQLQPNTQIPASQASATMANICYQPSRLQISSQSQQVAPSISQSSGNAQNHQRQEGVVHTATTGQLPQLQASGAYQGQSSGVQQSLSSATIAPLGIAGSGGLFSGGGDMGGLHERATRAGGNQNQMTSESGSTAEQFVIAPLPPQSNSGQRQGGSNANQTHSRSPLYYNTAISTNPLHNSQVSSPPTTSSSQQTANNRASHSLHQVMSAKTSVGQPTQSVSTGDFSEPQDVVVTSSATAAASGGAGGETEFYIAAVGAPPSNLSTRAAIGQAYPPQLAPQNFTTQGQYNNHQRTQQQRQQTMGGQGGGSVLLHQEAQNQQSLNFMSQQYVARGGSGSCSGEPLPDQSAALRHHHHSYAPLQSSGGAAASQTEAVMGLPQPRMNSNPAAASGGGEQQQHLSGDYLASLHQQQAHTDSRKTSGANTPSKDGADTPPFRETNQVQNNSSIFNLTSKRLLVLEGQQPEEAQRNVPENSQNQAESFPANSAVIPRGMFE